MRLLSSSYVCSELDSIAEKIHQKHFFPLKHQSRHVRHEAALFLRRLKIFCLLILSYFQKQNQNAVLPCNNIHIQIVENRVPSKISDTSSLNINKKYVFLMIPSNRTVVSVQFEITKKINNERRLILARIKSKVVTQNISIYLKDQVHTIFRHRTDKYLRKTRKRGSTRQSVNHVTLSSPLDGMFPARCFLYIYTYITKRSKTTA